MIVETSAIIAILKAEAGSDRLAAMLQASSESKVSAVSMLEASIVIGQARHPLLDELMAEARIEIVPFTAEQLAIARAAYFAYGTGSGSKAKLNFGGCCSYALAKQSGEPLLFVGEDFKHTDIPAAL